MDGTSLQVSKGPIAVWIGLYQTENGLDWTWMDGTPTGYFNWDTDEPNDGAGGVQEDCTNMYENSGFWNDFDCNSYFGYVCEVYKSKEETDK